MTGAGPRSREGDGTAEGGATMTSESREPSKVMERLEKLERQNHRLRMMGGMVFVLAVVGLLMGQASQGKVPSVIEAERFVLKDTGGKIRGELKTLSERDVVTLDLYGPQGAILTRLGTGGLWLLDKDEKSRVVLNTSSPGVPGLLISDSDGKGGISLMTTPHGPDLSFRDKDGKARVTISVTTVFGPVLSILDNNEKARIEIRVRADGSSYLTLSDKQEKERAGLHVSAEGLPSLEVSDKDGKVVWKAP